MLEKIGHPWEGYATQYRHGRVIKQVPYKREVTFVHKRTNEPETVFAEGMRWEAVPADRFETTRLLDDYII